MAQPRFHHDQLIHFAIPHIAFREGLGLMGILHSPLAHEFLASVLQQVSEVAESGCQPDFDARDIGVELMRVSEKPCAILQMPPPSAPAEAFFAAIVLLDAGISQIRFFTLDLDATLNGSPVTLLAEWFRTASGELMCKQLGPGPSPDAEQFMHTLRLHLQSSFN